MGLFGAATPGVEFGGLTFGYVPERDDLVVQYFGVLFAAQVAAGCFFFSVTKHFRNATVNRKLEWMNVFVAMVHDFSAGAAAVYSLAHLGERDFAATSDFQGKTVAMMLSYLAFDFVMLWPIEFAARGMSNNMVVYSIHHFLGLASWGLIHVCGVGGGLVQWIHLCEFSTFFMHIRWFMLSTETRKDHPLLIGTQLMFALLFLIIRQICMPVVYWKFLHIESWPTEPWVYYVQTGVMASFIALNSYWFLAIMTKVRKHLGGGGGDKKGDRKAKPKSQRPKSKKDN